MIPDDTFFNWEKDNEFKQLLAEFFNHPLQYKSITLAELYCFYKAVCFHKIECIVESGTFQGVTTKRLSMLFPQCEIISYESNEDRYKNIPVINLADNIRYVYGVMNSEYLLGKTALLIDGPKGEGAISLIKMFFDKVLFAAMHDTSDRCLDSLKNISKRVSRFGSLAIIEHE